MDQYLKRRINMKYRLEDKVADIQYHFDHIIDLFNENPDLLDKERIDPKGDRYELYLEDRLLYLTGNLKDIVEEEAPPIIQDFYATMGIHRPFEKYHIIVKAPDKPTAHRMMFEAFDKMWSFLYDYNISKTEETTLLGTLSKSEKTGRTVFMKSTD